HALDVAADVRVDLAVGAFQVGIRDDGGSAVSGPCDVHGVQAALLDGAVDVGVKEAEARACTPVTQQTGLHVLRPEGFAKERVVQQVDLTDGQVVRGPPPGIDEAKLFVGEGSPSLYGSVS